MTEQELEVLGTRLRRIWAPETELNWEFASNSQKSEEHLDYFAEWVPGIGFEYFWWDRLNSFVLQVSKKMALSHGPIIIGLLRCYMKSGQIEAIFPIHLSHDMQLKNLYDQFAAQYLDPFRRGCWLSGCPIEATTHEKAEWMQDFTREEIEAWNLKI